MSASVSRADNASSTAASDPAALLIARQ